MHNPRLCIECPYHLFSISLNPVAPDMIILFKLLVQLQWFTVISVQVSTTDHLTSIHSCQSIGRIPIVTLRQVSGNLQVYELTM